MENRIGIKILTMLLIEGLSNAKAKLLCNDMQAEGPRVAHFFQCGRHREQAGDWNRGELGGMGVCH
jgi:hypothetical protein